MAAALMENIIVPSSDGTRMRTSRTLTAYEKNGNCQLPELWKINLGGLRLPNNQDFFQKDMFLLLKNHIYQLINNAENGSGLKLGKFPYAEYCFDGGKSA
ncbi:MAG: hypothetical protein HYW50_00010 [Candidatus Diapherotrites archaeon]|nr:hypothetical protein [Candidatus Diapherotrites archaeon]